MDLVDLKRSSKPQERNLDLDAFLEGAIHYAHGREFPHPLTFKAQTSAKMQRSTFTLSNDAKQQLTLLSGLHGFSRSHLLRLLINQFQHQAYYIQSERLRQYKIR